MIYYQPRSFFSCRHCDKGYLETEQKLIRNRIKKIDKNIKDAFEFGMFKNNQRLKKIIEDWENERRELIIREQETTKIDLFGTIELIVRLL